MISRYLIYLFNDKTFEQVIHWHTTVLGVPPSWGMIFCHVLSLCILNSKFFELESSLTVWHLDCFCVPEITVMT